MKILIFDEASMLSLKMTVEILLNQLKCYQSTRIYLVKFVFLLITVENLLTKRINTFETTKRQFLFTLYSFISSPFCTCSVSLSGNDREKRKQRGAI